jgi:hypothetical protein
MKYATLVILLGALSCGRPAGPSPAERARESARRHSSQAFQVLDLVSSRIEEFFGRRQEKIQAFSDEIFSLRGKWRALFWGREDFERHVRRRFENLVFRSEDFDREVVEPVRADLAFAIDASEAGVAADLERWARASRGDVSAPDVRPALSRLVANEVLGDLGINVASLAVSEAAALAASQILTRAGVFGASVAAGAGASWATFGITLVVGAVVGIVIDSTIGEELEGAAGDTVRFELDALRMTMMESRDGVWWAARRALETHGRALERSAGQLVKGGKHGAGRA